MPRSRPPYPPEFRHQMVELIGAGQIPEQLSQEFEPSAQTIRNRVARADRHEGRRTNGLTSAAREEPRAARAAEYPLGLGMPRDIDEAVRYLASSASRSVCGTALHISGGYQRGNPLF